MRPARLLLLGIVLGAWLALSGATILGAVTSFRDAPSAAAAQGDAAARGARLQAMRFNGALFEGSARAQLLLAGLAVVLAGWAPVPSRAAIGCVLAAALIASALAFVVVPRSAAIAQRRIDALQRGDAAAPSEDEEARFAALHRAYGALDFTKSLLLVGAAWTLSRAIDQKRGAAA